MAFQTVKAAPCVERQACECYEAAGRLRNWSHAAQYNCGVALSDMARAVGPGNRAAAAHYLLGAAAKYATSLKWNPNNPQVRRSAGSATPLVLLGTGRVPPVHVVQTKRMLAAPPPAHRR